MPCSGAASARAKFKYSLLSANVSLEAGADAQYALIRSYPAATTVELALRNFFHELRLPANVAGPLDEDEVIVLEYGGYLKLGASVGFGYEMGGGVVRRNRRPRS